MLEDRRHLAADRAVTVVKAYESARGATVIDAQRGAEVGHTPVADALADLGRSSPLRPSADLVSRVLDEIRIIEVKGRGGLGSFTAPEREIETLSAAGDSGWLYVVWNTTQPADYQLWTIQDPARLPWTLERPAERTPDQYRGVRHEATFECAHEHVKMFGTSIDLSGLDLPPKT